MKFHFEKSFCVALGTFNIYIIQPSLLLQMHALDSVIGSFFGDFTQPGWRFSADGATWVVRPERLAVETTDPKFDCGKRVLSVLKILQWTPIVAVGTNLVFRADAREESDLPPHFRMPQFDGHELLSRSCETVVKDGDREFRISLKSDGENLKLFLNIHANFRKTSEEAKVNQIDQNSKACDACGSFMRDCNIAVERAKSILGGEFSWDYQA